MLPSFPSSTIQRIPNTFFGCLISCLFLFFFFSAPAPHEGFSSETDKEALRFPNGFQAILIENPNAPVIASVISVRVGSSRENFSTSGMSHMLEHLLFNGTQKRTQKELYDEQDFYGIYNNAHTTREYTNFMLLAHKDQIRQALDIQSDMLFHSTLPSENFEKEKGIILNEIALSRMKDESLAEDFFQRKYYQGSPYNLPVLGLPETIQKMDRATVYAFYKKFYVPNNMTAIVMGDFQTEEMKEVLQKYFGKAAPGPLPKEEFFLPRPNLAAGLFISQKKTQKILISLGSPAPPPHDPDFFPYYLLIRLESLDFKERINQTLRSRGENEALSATMDVDFKKGFSTLMATIDLSTGRDPAGAVTAVEEEFKSLPERTFPPEKIQGILATLKMEELSLRERAHYFGMMASAKLSAGGWTFTKNFTGRLAEVTPYQLRETAKKYFSSPFFLATALVPGGNHREITEEEKKEYFHRREKPEVDSQESLELVNNWTASKERKSPPPVLPGEPVAQESNHKTSEIPVQRKILKNGLTVILKQSSPGGIFAAHVLVKNRHQMEPTGKEGIAELLHNLLKEGTTQRNKETLQKDLMALGATLKTADDPYIPFDDYYSSNDFSYIRFEVPDDNYQKGLEILSDVILHPRLEADAMEQGKKRQMGLAEDKAEEAAARSRHLLYSALLPGTRLDHSLIGTRESLSSISPENLRDFHKNYFSPSNLILSIVTGRDSGKVLEATQNLFGDIPDIPASSPKPDDFSSVARDSPPSDNIIREKLGKSQSYIRVGKIVEVDPEDRAAVNILSALLSQRVSFQLREKEGLSYSTWAGFTRAGDIVLLGGAIGTTPDKIETARKGLLREIAGFTAEAMGEKDIQRAVNGLKSERMMKTLTRIGQAFSLGLMEFQRRVLSSLSEETGRMERVTVEEIRSAARKYISTGGMITVIVE